MPGLERLAQSHNRGEKWFGYVSLWTFQLLSIKGSLAIYHSLKETLSPSVYFLIFFSFFWKNKVKTTNCEHFIMRLNEWQRLPLLCAWADVFKGYESISEVSLHHALNPLIQFP